MTVEYCCSCCKQDVTPDHGSKLGDTWDCNLCGELGLLISKKTLKIDRSVDFNRIE